MGIENPIRKYVKFKSKIVNQEYSVEESYFDIDKEMPERLPVDEKMCETARTGIPNTVLNEYDSTSNSLPPRSGTGFLSKDEEIKDMIKTKELRIWTDRELKYFRASLAVYKSALDGERWLKEHDPELQKKSASTKKSVSEPIEKLKIPFLSPLQNQILNMTAKGLTDKEIAFRLSGNRKGKWTSNQVRYQFRLAKKKIKESRTLNAVCPVST
ncbi:MAG: hypothetical protein COX51_07440 [Syntrophobacteraceae bacterium CG23_combo_of_CG06-09_8_20_14_all_50_8]|nr:MAG: hypothetical protein COX51_07440 [Syntrophobacteraceae bacterium CG23_combo_of_CG06-09_8_20_14_all_50_8]